VALQDLPGDGAETVQRAGDPRLTLCNRPRTDMPEPFLAVNPVPRPALGLARPSGVSTAEGGGALAPAPSSSRPPLPLWMRVGLEASRAAAREPLLRRRLEALVLKPATPGRVVAAVLSDRLAGGDSDLAAIVDEALLVDRALVACIEEDLDAAVARDPACPSALHALLHLKGFQALAAHRVANSLWGRGRRDAAAWLAHQTSVALGVDIHPAAVFGRRVLVDHATGIVIGETAVVEDDVSILHGVTLGATGKQRGDRHPKVRQGTWIGAGAQVLGNIVLGRMSRIGAGSVVLSHVPAHATAVGVPARIARLRTPQRAAA
jgi:serine O-acetyltransferase